MNCASLYASARQAVWRGTAPDDAEDVVQEAVARTWLAAPRDPDAFAFRTARNVQISAARSTRQRTRAALSEHVDPAPSALDVLTMRETVRDVLAAVADLSPVLRRAVTRCVARGHSNGLPTAERMALSRARRVLAQGVR